MLGRQPSGLGEGRESVGGRVYVSYNYREPERTRPRLRRRVAARVLSLVVGLSVILVLAVLALVLGVATSCSITLH